MNLDYSTVLSQFPFKGSFLNLTAVREGHINTTLKAEFTGGKYILQKINTVVFTKPDELMANIFLTTEYITKKLEEQGIDPSRRSLKFLKTIDGKPYFRDKDGSCWRSYIYIDNCYTLKENCSPEEIYKAAKAFGVFQNTLSDFDGSKLYESIENFHNTPLRFKAFLDAVEKDIAGRAKDVADEIEFFKARENETGIVTALLANGGLPVRVTHNDTKINNILFDRDTKEALCIIDLDTIMPGSSLYDFGD
ncbi:MAG: aminoglycoside phosphotransferase family protein, partial [Clostridia bacterium]|nr:aminoglycoside phosphotransferase family protein [Clostridia bacterium]